MADPNLSSLLKWSVENSEASHNTTTTNTPQTQPSRPPNPAALAALFGGASDADLMKQAMHTVQSNAPLADRLTAFDNFEQLVENLDNANNMGPLGLWTPVLEQLYSPEADIRRMAAWCIGTAVQNNIQTQEKLVVMEGIPRLVKMVLEEEDRQARRKAVYALSSSIRNCQPATDAAVKALPREVVGEEKLFAQDMVRIDSIMNTLRK